MNQDTDAVYILSPQPHIVDCLMADFERRRYHKAFLIWTSCAFTMIRMAFVLSADSKGSA